ncbi:MAG: protein kinase [Myxococcales bacterium]|nr:protein kinase [Myxococcales bacterium]
MITPRTRTKRAEDAARARETQPPVTIATRRTRVSEVQQPGTVVGAYRLLGLLGKGGMGEVYRAEHIADGRVVAIKMLRQRFAADSEAVKRFMREARIIGEIDHENVVAITECFDGDEGPYYFVMELLEGATLDVQLCERQLSLAEILDIAPQICSGLSAMHAAGVIHRDLKPNNIFLSPRPGDKSGFAAKLLDFGLVKLTAAALREARESGVSSGGLTTSPDMVLGTPEYMSPEQIRDVDNLDERTDIYALGVVLYEMICGVRPIVAPSLGDLLVKVVTQQPAPVKHALEDGTPVPERLRAVIMRCLQKDPEARPQSAREVYDELAAIKAGDEDSGAFYAESEPTLNVTERLPVIDDTPRRWRRAPLLGLGAVGAAALVIALLSATSSSSRSTRHVPAATPAPAASGSDTARADERRGVAVAELAQVWRDVKHKRADSALWQLAERGRRLYHHDAIKTGQRSRAQVLFRGGQRLDVDEQSMLVIDKLAGRAERAMRVARGTLRVLAKPGVALRVITADGKLAVIKGRGDKPAQVRLRRGPDGRLELAMLSGSGEITIDGKTVRLGDKQLVEIGAGGKLGALAKLLAYPTLLAPGVDAVLPAGRKLSLRWRAVAGALRYRVQVSRQISFDERIVDRVVSETSIDLMPEGDSARFVWRVSAIDARGHASEFGFARRFAVAKRVPRELPLGRPVAPDDGASVERIRDRTRLSLHWSGPAGARYDVVVARQRSLHGSVFRRANLEARSVDLPTLEAGTYYWAVFQRGVKGKRRLGRPRRVQVTDRKQPSVHLPKIEWK